MKQKKIIGRPWGRRRRGGWLIKPDSLIKVLKEGEAVKVGEVTVGTKNLIKIVRGFALPEDQVLLVKCNGSLDIQNIGLRYVPNPAGPNPRKGEYYALKPRLQHKVTLHDGAWINGKAIGKLIVLKPKRF